jgi:hypothetical protein
LVTLWVVNASPVILLARVGRLDLLQQLGPPVVIPEAAVLEIQRKGSGDPAVQALAQATWLVSVDPGPIPANVAALGLGVGKTAVLAHALGILPASSFPRTIFHFSPKTARVCDHRLVNVVRFEFYHR